VSKYLEKTDRTEEGNRNVWEELKMGAGKRNVILVGDIGGTNTRLAIIEVAKEHFNFLPEETFLSCEEVLK
jgi:hexokinase